MKSSIKRGIAFICTAFLLLSGYAQHRVGVYATPQYNITSKGLAFNGGAYYEKDMQAYTFLIGLGYMYMGCPFKDILGGTSIQKMNFLSIPIGGGYQYELADNLMLDIQGIAGLNYLVKSSAQEDLSGMKRLGMSINFGIGCTYLFSDNIGVSLLPTVSGTMVFATEKPLYWGVGGQIRFFYAFGY